MNIITQAQFLVHIPTKGGHLQTIRASDGFHLQLDRTSGILTIFKDGESGTTEVSPCGWISLATEPPPPTVVQPAAATPAAAEETTKVWTKPPTKKK